MNAVAIIPARGGSRRLPRKNMLPVLDHPMLWYPVQAALKSRLFDQVIVSTDDADIKSVALSAGARVMDRPLALADDSATVARVCLDVLGKLGHENVFPDLFCCIYATAVFITPKDLTGAFQMTEDCPDTDGIMAVSRFNLNPFQALKDQGCYLKPVWPDQYNVQSQHQPQVRASNGTFYWVRSLAFDQEKSFYLKHLKGYDIPWIRAVDINTPEDYETALILAPLFLTKKEFP